MKRILAAGALGLALLAGPARADELKLGPNLTFQAPHIAGLGFDVRPLALFSAGLEGIYIPQITIDPANQIKVGMNNIELHARFHPFGGAFLLGAIVGIQNLSGSAVQPIVVSGQSVPTQIQASVKTPYLTPHFGWAWTTSGGFLFGLEGGWQLALSASSSLDVTIQDPALQALLTQVQQTPQYVNLQNQVQSDLDQLGRHGVPYFALRFGWMF